MVYIIYTMYMCIGEMTSYKPINGGFVRQTEDYTDKALAFAQGLGFWYNVCLKHRPCLRRDLLD